MMLEVSGLAAGYGESQVLFGISFEVRRGEVVTLLGRNGMGKTTTISALMGIVPLRAGEILFEGKAIQGLPSYRVAERGLGLVPEGRQVFPNLTVRENLVATAANRAGAPRPWTLELGARAFPGARGTAQQHGRAALGRGAADAVDRPCAHDQSAASHSR